MCHRTFAPPTARARVLARFLSSRIVVLAAALLFVLALGAVAAPAPVHAACATPPGDVNESGKADITDVQCSILYVLYFQSLFAGPPVTCAKPENMFWDLDCDGVSQVNDLILLIQIVVGDVLSTAIDADQNLCADTCEQIGNCCGKNIAPGCSNETCEACVCAVSPECCTAPWGSSCHLSALVDCQEECACVAKTSEQCCVPHAQSGCEKPACTQCVCSLQPSCCSGAWDDSCTALAGLQCEGDCGCKTGLACDCPHPESGCGIGACESCVCANAPFCCAIEWTQACANIASEQCSSTCNTGDLSQYACSEPKIFAECDLEWCSGCATPQVIQNSAECCMGTIWSESFDGPGPQFELSGNDPRYPWTLDPKPPKTQQGSALVLKPVSNPTAPYTNFTIVHAATYPIELPPDAAARVSFSALLNEQKPNQYPIHLRVRSEQTETVVWSTARLTSKPLWQKVCVRLDAFAGQTIVLEWSFSGPTTGHTDLSVLFVDDVVVRAQCDKVDQDGDGLPDLEEAQWMTDAANPDSDGDGLPDGFEVAAGLNPAVFDAVFDDQDTDGLDTLMEATLKTDPLLADSDGDGLGDGLEWLTVGTDPLLWDTDGDGLSDGDEVMVVLTLPLVVDTDGGGRGDGDEVHVDGTDPLNAADDGVCGNGVCDGGDACGNCAIDCGPCPVCDPKGCGDKPVEMYMGNPYAGQCTAAGGSSDACNAGYWADWDGQYKNCFFTASNGCLACDNEQKMQQFGCKNTCPQPPAPGCPEDPKRIQFAGFESEFACQTYGNSCACNQAYFADAYGPRSCYWDTKKQECRGCTTRAEYSGLCADACGTGSPPKCEGDPTRTLYVGGYYSDPCEMLNGKPDLCKTAYHTSAWGAASCDYDFEYNLCLRCVKSNADCANTCAVVCENGKY